MVASLGLVLFDQQARRYKSIYYTLIGKVTVSNLLAASTYQLLPYYHLYPKLKWSVFQEGLRTWQKQHWLELSPKEATAWLTGEGYQRKQQNLRADFWPRSYNYWYLGDWQLQWQRLLLAVQVVSNACHQEFDYQPLTESLQAQQLVKKWFYQGRPQDRIAFSRELSQLLTQMTPKSAQLLANSFSSASFVGLSQQQLQGLTHYSAKQLQLAQIEALSELLIIRRQHSHSYPQLSQLLPLPTSPLPQSVAQTYQAVLDGLSGFQLLHSRPLKAATFKEHLLMAAILIPDFPFTAAAVRDLYQQDQGGFFTRQMQTLQKQRRKGGT